MRQNKICCKWQSKEIWRMMTYIRPWVIVKSLGQRISYCLSDHLRKNLICSNKLLAPSCQRWDQFRLLAFGCFELLWQEAESFLISSYALLQTKTAWRIHLQKTGTGEFFLFTFSSSKHFCLLLEFIESRRKKKYKNSKPSLVDYYYHVLLLLLRIMFLVLFLFFFRILRFVFVFFPPS